MRTGKGVSPAQKKKGASALKELFAIGHDLFPEIPHTKCGNDFLFDAWTQIDISWLFLAPTDQVGQMKYARSMFEGIDIPSAYRAFKQARRTGGRQAGAQP